MKCTNCGHELPEGAYFCSDCGAKVESSSGSGYGREYVVQDEDTGGSYNRQGRAPVASGSSGSGLSIASMVLGIGALLFSCCSITGIGVTLPFFMAVAGIILGVISTYKKCDGHGMAVAGIVCSIIAIVFCVIGVLFFGALNSAMGGYFNPYAFDFGYYW